MGDDISPKNDAVPERQNPLRQAGGQDQLNLASIMLGNNDLFGKTGGAFAQSQSAFMKELNRPNPGAVKAVERLSDISIFGVPDDGKRGDKQSVLLMSDQKPAANSELTRTASTIARQNKGADVLAPLAPLARVQELEQQHLKPSADNPGRLEFNSDYTDAQGNRILTNRTPESLNQEINENYWAALQAAAESEPARRKDLAKIEQKIEACKQQLGLTSTATPSSQELAAMQKPEDPQQRAAFEQLQQLVEAKEALEASSLKNVEQSYEQFLGQTGQTDALTRFNQFKPMLETLPFQDWLNRVGRSTLIQSIVRGEDNPFLAHQHALEALQGHPPNKEAADRYFRKAMEAADKLNPKQLDEELARIKAEKAKAKEGSEELVRLQEEEKALTLLKASPGLMKAAYADFLISTGHPKQAFDHLMAASDNATAVALLNNDTNNHYLSQLIDRSLHDDKETISQSQIAYSHLQEFDDRFNRAKKLSESGNPADKQKAAEELKAAYEAARAARSAADSLSVSQMTENARLFEKAIEAEKAKSPNEQNQEKLKMLEEQHQRYANLAESLTHLQSLTCLAQGFAELTSPADNGQTKAERGAIARDFLARVQSDPTLTEAFPELKSRIELLQSLSREQTYGEQAWDWLRQNSGSLVAISVGAIVFAATIETGPGAAVCASVAAAAVSGIATDYVSGNEVSLESFGGHGLEGLGVGIGGLAGKGLAALKITSRLSKPVAGMARGVGAATAGAAAEHIPELLSQGPSVYLSRVIVRGAAGGLLPGSANPLLKRAPLPVQSFASRVPSSVAAPSSRPVKDLAEWILGTSPRQGADLILKHYR